MQMKNTNYKSFLQIITLAIGLEVNYVPMKGMCFVHTTP
jgi:hypothetical protein